MDIHVTGSKTMDNDECKVCGVAANKHFMTECDQERAREMPEECCFGSWGSCSKPRSPNSFFCWNHVNMKPAEKDVESTLCTKCNQVAQDHPDRLECEFDAPYGRCPLNGCTNPKQLCGTYCREHIRRVVPQYCDCTDENRLITHYTMYKMCEVCDRWCL